MKKFLLIVLGLIFTVSIGFAQQLPTELKYAPNDKEFNYLTDINLELAVKLPKELLNRKFTLKGGIKLRYNSLEVIKNNDQEQVIVDFSIKEISFKSRFISKKFKQTFDSDGRSIVQLVLSPSGEVLDVILKKDDTGAETEDIDLTDLLEELELEEDQDAAEETDTDELTEAELEIAQEQIEQLQKNYEQTLIDFLKFYFGLRHHILPEQPVMIGDSWTINHLLKTDLKLLDEGEGIVFPVSYQLVRFKKSGKNNLAYFKTTADVLFAKTIDLQELRAQMLAKQQEQIDDDSNVEPEDEDESDYDSNDFFGLGNKIDYKLPFHLNGETVFDLTNGCLYSRKIEIKGVGQVTASKFDLPIQTEISYKIKIKTKRK